MQNRNRGRKYNNCLTCNELLNLVYLKEDSLYFSLHNVSETIQKKIKAMIRNYVIPFFSDKTADITLLDVSAFYRYLASSYTKSKGKEAKLLSKKYQNDIILYTKAAFAMAGDIDVYNQYRNPFESKTIAPIKVSTFTQRTPAFEYSDIQKLFSKRWLHPVIEALALVCAFTGLRVNEALCLKKEDFIVRDYFVEINICKNWNPASCCIKSTKTPSGNRTVVIPIRLFNYILPVLYWQKDCFVFSMNGNRPFYYRIYSLYLNKAMLNNNVEDFKERKLVFYSFRSWYKSFTSPRLSFELSNYVMGHSERTMAEHYFHFQSTVHADFLLNAVSDIPVNLEGTIIE